MPRRHTQRLFGQTPAARADEARARPLPARRFVLPVVTLAIFLTSLIHGFVKTQNLEERIGNQVADAMWAVAQAEIAYLNVLTALESYHDGDPAVGREDVVARFETLWRRVPVLLDGSEAEPLRALLDEDLALPLEPMLADLQGLVPVVGSLEPGDRRTVDAIRATLEPYGPLLERLVLDTHRERDWRVALYKIRDVTLYLEVGPSLAGILFSGALLVVLLRREIRRGDNLLRKSQAAEGALVQARNLAEHANAAKSRFLVAANHDLRQPLQSLSLYTAAVQAAASRRETETICDEMSGAIETMGNLLDVLLDIENLEEGRVRVQQTDFAVAELLDSLGREFKLAVRSKGLDLRVVPSSLILHSDRLLLERIVQNFVSNAISYTNEGKVLVGCRPRGDSARIEVWDNGVGIAEGKLETIFEDYYQVDNPARDRRKGLGLGLAIVQRVARLLDHRIEVRSRLGKGTMFAVEVPLVGRSSLPGAKAARPAGPEPDLAGKVLVAIEDDPAILQGMRRLLESWGARAICGRSARDALDQLTAAGVRPDLIIADYRLPDGETGIGIVQELRAVFDADLPAIVITGDTSTSITRLIEASGCHLVHKPLDPLSLRRLARERIRGAAGSGPDRSPPAEIASATADPGAG